MLRAAEEVGVQVVWDLCHYGWPDHLNIWRPGFVDGFARFAAAAAALVREESDRMPFWCPVNEISYWAWAGATVARFNPNARGRGAELKHQLVRASIAAIEALWSVDRRARIVHIDPVINVVPRSSRPQSLRTAEAHRQAQFEALDMLAGWSWPGLGGRPEYLDVIGVNYYSDNQWFAGGRTIKVGPSALPSVPRDPGRDASSATAADLRRRDRRRGNDPRSLAALRRRGGPGRRRQRHPGRGHLSLPDRRLSWLDQPAALRGGAARSSGRAGSPRDLPAPRRRASPPAGAAPPGSRLRVAARQQRAEPAPVRKA